VRHTRTRQLTFALVLSMVQLAIVQKPFSAPSIGRIMEPPRQAVAASLLNPLQLPKLIHEEAPMDPVPIPCPQTVVPTRRPQGWILSDATWKNIDRFPLKFDCEIDRGKPYVGVRFVFPFGG